MFLVVSLVAHPRRLVNTLANCLLTHVSDPPLFRFLSKRLQYVRSGLKRERSGEAIPGPVLETVALLEMVEMYEMIDRRSDRSSSSLYLFAGTRRENHYS